uniref:Leucine--tRNA ligase, cytoplasmic n=1 Tax=Fundulus heteroclitus TaxID=8078 RepID=A0A146UV14_FUNHE
MAATVRPETVSEGLTNVWVSPSVEYVGVKAPGAAGDVQYVVTPRSARNMAYQGLVEYEVEGEKGRVPVVLRRLRGSEMVGRVVTFRGRQVPVFPLESVVEAKGTGVVASVPSDSPEDFGALEEMKKGGVSVPDPIPIIEVPGLGSLSAPAVFARLGATEAAKEEVYLRGFNEGIMLVGEMKGARVRDARPVLRKRLIEAGDALAYSEPEAEVVSRSGDECVVALCAQWYIDYGEPGWKKQALAACERLETFSTESKNNLVGTIQQLHEHACSRSYGLGSRVPWDDQYLIESLTDSTIYMAYYTVAHILQGLDVADFSEEASDAMFDAVFLEERSGGGGVVAAMQREFRFWYPVDLRCTGKDLLQNHIPYFIYTHCAIFPEPRWPRAVNANGLLQLNAAKMSKSTGNFLTLRQSIQRFSADATRLVLADAGDSVEDANFMETQAEAVLLRLFAFVEWASEVCAMGEVTEAPEAPSFADRVLVERAKECVIKAEQAILSMQFKEAVKHCFFAMQSARHEYTELSTGGHPNPNLLKQFLKTQLIILSVFCPHTAEHVYCRILRDEKNSVLNERWPSTHTKPDRSVIDAADHLADVLSNIRRKATPHATHLTIGIRSTYPEWQQKVIQILTQLISNKNIPENRELLALFNKDPIIAAGKKHLMPFAQMIKQKLLISSAHPFDESQLFADQGVLEYLRKSTGLAAVTAVEDPNAALPYKPTLRFSRKHSTRVSIGNPEPLSGHVEVRQFQIFDGESVLELSQRLARRVRTPQVLIAIQDRKQQTQIPQYTNNTSYRPLNANSTFHVDQQMNHVTCADINIDQNNNRLVYLTQQGTNK